MPVITRYVIQGTSTGVPGLPWRSPTPPAGDIVYYSYRSHWSPNLALADVYTSERGARTAMSSGSYREYAATVSGATIRPAMLSC